jgi:diguanylate cyclase
LYHLANRALLTFAYRETDLVQIALFIAVGLVTARLTENARRLRVIAMTDDLTGLHNLRSFEQRLLRAIQDARAGGGRLSMLVLDVDRLKSLNDTYGHLTGAEAVRHVGRILATHLPEDAIACRYGGDEFAVALPAADSSKVRAVAEDVCRAVHSSAPALAGRAFPAGTLSISVGVAHRTWPAHSVGDTDARDGEALFHEADAALYVAKSQGRNRLFVAEATTGPATPESRADAVPPASRPPSLA